MYAVESGHCVTVATVSSTTADLVIAHYDMTTLTCRASGCIAVALNWMDPQGVAVMPSWVVSNGSEMASVIEVNGTDGGVYTCIASSVLGVHSMTTTVRGCYLLIVATVVTNVCSI